MFGLASQFQTTRDLQRTKQCVLNMPSDSMVAQVNALVKTLGRQDLSPFKKAAGYEYMKDKFGKAKLTPMGSEMVTPLRVQKCPVQMEAELVQVDEMNSGEEGMAGFFLGLEVKILKVHGEESIVQIGASDRIDADRWKPLMMMMSFQQFYGLSGRLQPSRLAKINEEHYR